MPWQLILLKGVTEKSSGINCQKNEFIKKLAENSPLQKIVEPEDVAMAIMAYVTHLKHSTGARMVVDSGNFLK